MSSFRGRFVFCERASPPKNQDLREGEQRGLGVSGSRTFSFSALLERVDVGRSSRRFASLSSALYATVTLVYINLGQIRRQDGAQLHTHLDEPFAGVLLVGMVPVGMPFQRLQRYRLSRERRHI